MKKVLVTLFAVLGIMSMSAQKITFAGMTFDELINILENLQGQVFLSKGETRELANIVANSTSISNVANAKDLTWSTLNKGIVDIDESEGTIEGVNFGQALVQVHEPSATVPDFYIGVYVCPTITVKSPEGAIYTHQKMYNSRAKLQLTHSPDWLINCVMCNGEDITQMVSETGNGWFDTSLFPEEEKQNVKNDLTLVVSMETRMKHNDGDDVIADSDINLQVYPETMTLRFTDGVGNLKTTLIGRTISIKDITGKELYGSPLPEECEIVFLSNNKGVFYVGIEDVDQDFKIIME